MHKPEEPAQATGAQRRARTKGWHPTVLESAGFSPRTVVDVGAAFGTPQLYEAFPEASHVLLEPLKEHEPRLQAILEKYSGQYFLTAVGARDEKAIMNVELNRITMSSFHTRSDLTLTGGSVEKREVPVTKLDTLMEKHNFQPPFGLKIDTEGFEYQVIEGAPDFLRRTQFVIAEVSTGKRFEGSYSFPDFTEIMATQGFFLWDILNVGGKRFVDVVFRKGDLQGVSELAKSSRRAREREQAQAEQIRRLRQQLQNIHNSKTWKLLYGLNRIRTKTLRRRA